MKILDFDIENRPLSYWYDGQTTAEITAIAMCWIDNPNSMQVYLLGRDDPRYMLMDFVDAYNEADMVTGHYIRKHDLPHINSALMEEGMPTLGPKLVQDTRVDLIKKGDMPATQEHLAEMLGVTMPKVSMSQSDWREANRLTRAGLTKTFDRVTGDVLQHIELRKAMLKAGWLGTPKVWHS
jgi:hypothetical protein